MSIPGRGFLRNGEQGLKFGKGSENRIKSLDDLVEFCNRGKNPGQNDFGCHQLAKRKLGTKYQNPSHTQKDG